MQKGMSSMPTNICVLAAARATSTRRFSSTKANERDAKGDSVYPLAKDKSKAHRTCIH